MSDDPLEKELGQGGAAAEAPIPVKRRSNPKPRPQEEVPNHQQWPPTSPTTILIGTFNESNTDYSSIFKQK